MTWDWDPQTYPDSIRTEIPLYDRLQAEVVQAALRFPASTILELGVGSGETARRLLEAHPHARLTGIDSSESMLAAAREAVPADRTQLELRRLEDDLPGGPFDLVASVLAVHHLDAAGKAELFRRVASVLSPGGLFVLGDLVVPRRAEDAVTPVDGEYDRPSSADEQIRWLCEAGLSPTLVWEERDLAVLSAERPV